MALTKESQQKQDWLKQIADQAAKLLKDDPSPRQQMDWAVHRLEEASLYSGNPPPLSPRAWADQVIAQNLDLKDEAMPHLEERDLHPEKADSFESLILQLIPSESGL